jgi:hypothetical protein
VRCWRHQQMPPFVTPRCQVYVHFFFLEKQTKKNAQPNAQQLKFMKEAEAREVADEALLEQTKVQNTLVVKTKVFCTLVCSSCTWQGLLLSTIIIPFFE